MKYNYEKMGQYSDNYENYVKEFQENCKNVYLKNTKIITISQEKMRKDTGGSGLAYTDGVNIYIPELTRNQNVITSDLKDKNLHAKLIRRGFVLHELAHFEEDNPSSFLRTIYLEVSNKALNQFDSKKLLENKNGEIDKFNNLIVDEVSKRFELHYGKTLSKENYKKYVGIYLNNNLRKKNTVFKFYNYWVDRYIENQLPLLAKDQEDFRNSKSILHFLRTNMAKRELSLLSPSKADIKAGKVGIGLIDKLAILTSNYVDPRTREMFEEAKHFDKDKDWKKFYQLNRDEIEKMYSVNKKLSITHYGRYNTYIRNEKDIYSVHFNDAARRIFDKLNDEFKEEMEEEKKKREQEQKEQQEKNKDKKQDKNQDKSNEGEPSDDEGEGEGQGNGSGSGGKGNGKGKGGSGEPSDESDGESEEEGEGEEQSQGNENGSNGKGKGGGEPSEEEGEGEEQGNGNGGGNGEDEFSEDEMNDFKKSFQEDLNKKTDQEIMEEVINSFSEDELRELLEEAAKKEQEALNKQNDESFGKDKIQDQKGKAPKSEQGQPDNNSNSNNRGGNDGSEKSSPRNKKFEDTTFREHVNYKSSTVNDKTEKLHIQKPKVNEMIIKFEKLINDNREVKDLMNKAKELLKSSTTKQKKRMTSGSHKKIVDRAIRGDIKIFNKFVSFDLGDLDIFILIDNSGSMGETMKNAKIPFLQTRKDYSLFFCYLIKKIFEPLGANIDIKSFTTGNGRNSSPDVHRSSGITWENLQNIDDDDNTKRKNYDNIIQSKLNGAQSGTNLFAAFNEYVPSIRKHQYSRKRPVLLFTVSDGDTGFETNEEKNHSIYLNNLIEKDATIKHIKLCINSMSLIKYFGATIDKTRYVQSDSNVVAIKNGTKTVIGKNLNAKNNTITVDGKVMGKSNDFSYIENFEDISKFMLENLDSIFNIILNNGKQVISNHKRKINNTNKNLGPIM